jgi:hypothetical protein
MADLGLGADLYKIAPGPLPVSVVFRVACATGIPILVGMAMGEAIAGVIGASCALLTTLADIGTTYRSRIGTMAAATVAMAIGGTIGARYGGTTGAAEVTIVAAALVAGWVSGSHPGLGAVARFFAVATATGAGLHFANPMIAVAAAGGGAMAIVVAIVVWSIFGVPVDENVMDWRAGIRRALAGVDAGASFAIAYAFAAGAALLAADWLGVQRPYWATMTVLMVMRREGLESLRLVLQYMAGTLLGILLAGSGRAPSACAGSAGCVRSDHCCVGSAGVRAESSARICGVHCFLHSVGRPCGARARHAASSAFRSLVRRVDRLSPRARCDSRCAGNPNITKDRDSVEAVALPISKWRTSR